MNTDAAPTVTLVHQFFRFPDEMGIQRPFRIASSLASLGWKVKVVSSFSPSQPLAHKTRILTERKGELTVTRIVIPYTSGMREWERIRSYLAFGLHSIVETVKHRSEVVYVSSGPLSVIFPAIVMKLFRRSKVILEIRDEWPLVAIALGYLRNPVLRFFAKALEKVAINLADTIIVASPDMLARTKAKQVRPRPIHVLTNIADSAIFNVNQKHSGMPDLPSRYLVYAGSFGQSNGTEFLVELAQKLRDSESDLAVVAAGQGPFWDNTKELANNSRVLGSNYFQFPSLGANDLASLILGSVGCLSIFAKVDELSANSANKFFDALAAGKPVILNYRGWQAQLIESWKNGFVLDSQPDRLDLDSLISHFDNPSFVRRAGAQSRLLGSRFFSLSVAKDHLDQILSETISNSESNGRPTPCANPMCKLV